MHAGAELADEDAAIHGCPGRRRLAAIRAAPIQGVTQQPRQGGLVACVILGGHALGVVRKALLCCSAYGRSERHSLPTSATTRRGVAVPPASLGLVRVDVVVRGRRRSLGGRHSPDKGWQPGSAAAAGGVHTVSHAPVLLPLRLPLCTQPGVVRQQHADLAGSFPHVNALYRGTHVGGVSPSRVKAGGTHTHTPRLCPWPGRCTQSRTSSAPSA